MLDDLFVEKSASFQLIEIDNTKEASVDGKWKDPGAALYVQLLNAMYMAPDNESDVNDPRNKYTPDYLKETYLIAPINKIKYGPHGMTPFSRSGCKYPHHVIQNGKLVIHIQGLKAAYARAKQMGIFSGEVKEHLERHYKELGLYEGSKMQLDESMNQNFQDIENYIGEETGIDLYSTKDLFEERSHGKLNHSFRYGMNVENGHRIKVVFDLEKKNIVSVGLHDNTRDFRLSDKKSIGRVITHGSNDFVSRGIVKAIIDEDTNQRLKKVKMVGLLNRYINMDFFVELQKRQEDITLFNQCIRYYKYLMQKIGARGGIRLLEFPVKLREKLIKHPIWNLDKNTAQTFIVGQAEHGDSYKATRPESSMYKFVSNMNMDSVFNRGFNSRGVNKNTVANLKNKCQKMVNEIESYIRTLYERRKLKPDDLNLLHSIHSDLDQCCDYIDIAMKNANTETMISQYKDLVMLRDKLKEMMHKYKQRLESVEYTVSQIDGEIRVPTREDYLNPEFVKWLLFKTEEFEDDEPETFDFSVFETNPTIRNYVYGYFIDNIMRGIIRIKGIKPCIVDMLFVDPSFHRKHIGTILLQHAIDKFGKYDMTIYPFTDNIPAINLYKKLGFVIDSTIDSSPDYYSERNKNKKLYKMIRKSVELKPDPNIIQESFQWMDHFFEQMEDIENFEIRMIDEKDYTNPKFLEWLYKLDEFQPEEQELVFDMLHTNTTHGNYVYGYFINGIMRGFIRIRYKDTFNAYAISLLFVDPSFHNLGIGSKLLQFVIDQFGNKDIVLNVFTDNSIAIHIYKKFGFIIEETIDCSNEPECPEEFKDRQQYRMRRIGTNQINLRESKFFEAEESPPPTPTEEKKSDNETNDETNKSDTVEDKPSEEDNSSSEEDAPEKPKEESYPKKIDRAEEDKNGVRRKKLYIAFIEWAKEYNPKNIFGSIFDKDVFQTVYPFVPQKMRYFYRLANPMLCVLSGNLTFFAAGELKKLNAKNSKLNEFMIFAATDNDLRVYNNADDKIYRAVEENGMIKLDVAIADTFDIYIQNMINQGDILNGPIDENKE